MEETELTLLDCVQKANWIKFIRRPDGEIAMTWFHTSAPDGKSEKVLTEEGVSYLRRSRTVYDRRPSPLRLDQGGTVSFLYSGGGIFIFEWLGPNWVKDWYPVTISEDDTLRLSAFLAPEKTKSPEPSDTPKFGL